MASSFDTSLPFESRYMSLSPWRSTVYPLGTRENSLPSFGLISWNRRFSLSHSGLCLITKSATSEPIAPTCPATPSARPPTFAPRATLPQNPPFAVGGRATGLGTAAGEVVGGTGVGVVGAGGAGEARAGEAGVGAAAGGATPLGAPARGLAGLSGFVRGDGASGLDDVPFLPPARVPAFAGAAEVGSARAVGAGPAFRVGLLLRADAPVFASPVAAPRVVCRFALVADVPAAFVAFR